MSEDEILAQAGLDALVFLRLFRLGSRLFGILTFTLLPALVPVFWYADGADVPTQPDAGAEVSWATALSLGNLPHGSPRLWAPLAGAYYTTALTLLLLRAEFKHVARLRLRQLCRSDAPPEAYALLCLDIPSFQPRAPAETAGSGTPGSGEGGAAAAEGGE